MEDAGFSAELITESNDVNKLHLKLEGVPQPEDANIIQSTGNMTCRSLKYLVQFFFSTYSMEEFCDIVAAAEVGGIYLVLNSGIPSKKKTLHVSQTLER